MTRYSNTMRDILSQIREGFSPKEIKMAIGIASDKRYKGGNMTGAVNQIEKIKKGLSNHPQVAAVLKRQNEDMDEPASPDEGSMALDQLKFMKYAAEQMMQHIQGGGEFPEWMQNKLSGTHEKFKTLYANIEHGEMKESVELEEAKSSTGYELYHKDFSSAMQHAYAFAKKKFGIEVDPKEIDDKVASGPRKPSKGKTNSYRLLGKDGKKAIQVQVANLDDKRYELNMYKESVELQEKLKVSDGLGAWIDDFKKSDAPQFKGKSDEEKKNMAIAAFTDAGGKLGEETELEEASIQMVAKDLEAYAKKHGGIDKKDFMKAADLMKMNNKGGLIKFIDDLDTEPREKIIQMVVNTLGVKTAERMLKVKIREEQEPQKPDTAKAVQQGREDKKKTRIAQLQLQIAKAQETINKLNAQEKPSE